MNYEQALQEYLEGKDIQGEELPVTAPSQAVSDIVEAHHRALAKALMERGERDDVHSIVEAAGRFLLQVLPSLGSARGESEAKEPSKRFIELAETLSHEIRTPLTSVIASAGMLDEVLGPEVEQQERKLLANVLEGAERIKEQTDELMDLVGFQAGGIALERHRMDPRALLGNIFQRLSSQLGDAGNKLQVHMAEELPRQCTVDPDRLEQAIVNLVRQTMKVKPGATVEVRVEGNDGLQFAVMNNGGAASPPDSGGDFHPPLPAAYVGRHTPGLSLGLILCNEIVIAHGGRMWMSRTSGRAVTGFTVPC